MRDTPTRLKVCAPYCCTTWAISVSVMSDADVHACHGELVRQDTRHQEGGAVERQDGDLSHGQDCGECAGRGRAHQNVDFGVPILWQEVDAATRAVGDDVVETALKMLGPHDLEGCPCCGEDVGRKGCEAVVASVAERWTERRTDMWGMDSWRMATTETPKSQIWKAIMAIASRFAWLILQTTVRAVRIAGEGDGHLVGPCEDLGAFLGECHGLEARDPCDVDALDLAVRTDVAGEDGVTGDKLRGC